jgi:hypothetical protein
MEWCNPRWVFSINMCGCHKTRNNEQSWATNASSLLSPPLLRHQGYFIPFIDVHLWFCTGRGQIRFLGSDLCDCSLASSNYSSRLVYLFVGHAPKVIAFNANSVRLIIIVIREPQVTYSFSSQIMSYILNMFICIGMILLDNLLQCWMFIAIIYQSRTGDNTASLICTALVMFIIYPWIK